jgi:hypothetical protein
MSFWTRRQRRLALLRGAPSRQGCRREGHSLIMMASNQDRRRPVVLSHNGRIVSICMSLIRCIGTLRTRSFAVGVTLGLVSAVYAQSRTNAQLPAQPSGPSGA